MQLSEYPTNTAGTEAAEVYRTTGKWPSGVQIPKSEDVLTPDGNINWNKAPHGGYILDKNGEAIRGSICAAGRRNNRPVRAGDGSFHLPGYRRKTVSYDARSLPYVEDPAQYHQYEVVGDFADLETYVKNCGDEALKTQIDKYVKNLVWQL